MPERKDTEGSEKKVKIFLQASLFLTCASFATCHFGVQHEINKIPSEIRRGMADFDWIGVEWIALGTMALLAALVLALVAVKRRLGLKSCN